MRAVTLEDLRDLAAVENGPCVSLFMPTHTNVFGSEDEVRFRHSVVVVERELIQSGMSEEAAHKFTTALRNLPLTREWHNRKKGLAVFCMSHSMTEFWLNTPVVEQVVVGPRFHIKPLLSLISPGSHFYILILSRHDVRLLEADANGCRRLHLPNLPENMEKALNLQGADRGEQVHSAMRGDLGKEAAVFHGQGGHRETIKDEFREFCREINRAIAPVLTTSEDPLILAGVDYELAIFRGTCDFHHVASAAVTGGTDYLTDAAIYDRALPIAEEYHKNIRHRPLEKYRTMNRRILTSEDLEEILAGSASGKIEALIVDPDAVIMGRFDSTANRLDLGDAIDGADDLTEFAVAQTLVHRGTILTAKQNELPNDAKMCAVFRYW